MYEALHDRLKLLRLLVRLGVDPNIGMDAHQNALVFVGARLKPRWHGRIACSDRVLVHHTLTLFHPATVGYTCAIPLLVETRSWQHMDVMSTISSARRYATTYIDLNVLARCAVQCNEEQRPAQRSAMCAFVMGTHARVGATSAVYCMLCRHHLYDVHVLPHIWSYVCNDSMHASARVRAVTPSE